MAQCDIDFSINTDTGLHLELPGTGSVRSRISQIFGTETAKEFKKFAAGKINARRVEGALRCSSLSFSGGETRRIRFLAVNGQPVQSPVLCSFLDSLTQKVQTAATPKPPHQLLFSEFAVYLTLPEVEVECIADDPWPLFGCSDWVEIFLLLSQALKPVLTPRHPTLSIDEWFAAEAQKALELHQLVPSDACDFLSKWNRQANIPPTPPSSAAAAAAAAAAATTAAAAAAAAAAPSTPTKTFSDLNGFLPPWASCSLLEGGEAIGDASGRLQIKKSDLCRIKIISQAHCKIVMGVIDGNKLVAIDQHAAGERIKMEEMEFAVLNLPNAFVSSLLLSAPETIEIAVHEAGYVQDAAAALLALGYRTADPSLSSLSCHHRKTRVTHVPSFLGEPLSASSLIEISFCFSKKVKCNLIQNIIKRKACRFAVKFGDPLTNEAAAALVSKLAKCNKPFACAHGRPTVYPLGLINP